MSSGCASDTEGAPITQRNGHEALLDSQNQARRILPGLKKDTSACALSGLSGRVLLEHLLTGSKRFELVL